MSALVDTVVVRQTIGCASPIETQYYSATLVSFPPVCYYCGASEESLVEDDNTHQLKQDYAIVWPLCFLCKSQGKTKCAVSDKKKNNKTKQKKQDLVEPRSFSNVCWHSHKGCLAL